LLTITYDEVSLSQYEKDEEVKVEFAISYSMGHWKARNDIAIAIGVLCGVAVLWSLFRTWCWQNVLARML